MASVLGGDCEPERKTGFFGHVTLLRHWLQHNDVCAACKTWTSSNIRSKLLLSLVWKTALTERLSLLVVL